MRAGIFEWICNGVVFVSLFLILLNVYFLFRDDFCDRYGKGRIVGRNEHPGRVPGLNYEIEFRDPKTGSAHRSFWNPIAVGDGKIGDEVTVKYRDDDPAKFTPGGAPTYRIENTFKVYVVLSAVILLVWILRYWITTRGLV